MLFPLAAVVSLPIDLTLQAVYFIQSYAYETRFNHTRCLYQAATQFFLADDEVEMNGWLSRCSVWGLSLIEGSFLPLAPLLAWFFVGLCLQWLGIGLCFLSTLINQLPSVPPVITDAMAYLPSFRFFTPERSVNRLDDELFSPNARL